MPLSQPLAEFRQQLEAQLRDNQLPEALNALLQQLPEGSEKYRIVSALITRLNAANKERFRNTITLDEYQRRVDQVSADFFDLLGDVTEADFDASSKTSVQGKNAKQGTVLYKVPHTMPLQKPMRCIIRVAVEEEAILENIMLDQDVKTKSQVEISDVMSAELVDPEDGTFRISALNARTQLVRDTGYTEWIFNVTPLIEGLHQLLVKVSIMEIVPGFAEPIPREISVLESVTIVTEAPAPSDVEGPVFKTNGQSFAFQTTESITEFYEVKYKGIEAPMSGRDKSKLRALAFSLAFLVIASVAGWSFAAEPLTWAYIRNFKDTPEAYANFIEKFPKSSHKEKAYFYKAQSSGQLVDFQMYQDSFPNGNYNSEVLNKVAQLENIADNKTSKDTVVQPLVIDNMPTPFFKSRGTGVVMHGNDDIKMNHDSFLIIEMFNNAVRQRYIDNLVRQEHIANTSKRENSSRGYFGASFGKPPYSTGTGSTGTPGGGGTGENPFGKNNGSVGGVGGGEGTGSGVSVGGGLSGRAVRFRAKINSTTQKLGKVVVEVCIDKDGKVISANYTLRGSSTMDSELRALAISNAKSYRFVPSVIEKECGTISFVFKLEGSDGVTSSHSLSDNEALPDGVTASKSAPTEETTRTRRSGVYDRVLVEGGTYTMGSPESEGDRYKDECQHSVTVRTFSIGQYEVTQADWREIMDEDLPELEFKGCDDCPVEDVSWNNIQDFLKKLNAKHPGKNYRLPTEEEWEYAARGGNKSKWYQYSGSNDLGKVAWYSDNSGSKTHRVGDLVANELGIYDMSGNVYEWCQDLYRPYPGCSGDAGSLRVLRGGSWFYDALYCRVAFRLSYAPGGRYSFIGFRLASSSQ